MPIIDDIQREEWFRSLTQDEQEQLRERLQDPDTEAEVTTVFRRIESLDYGRLSQQQRSRLIRGTIDFQYTLQQHVNALPGNAHWWNGLSAAEQTLVCETFTEGLRLHYAIGGRAAERVDSAIRDTLPWRRVLAAGSRNRPAPPAPPVQA